MRWVLFLYNKSMKKEFTVKAIVWKWASFDSPGMAGDGGWCFITLGNDIYENLRKVYKKGFVRIEAKVGKSVWKTSLFPHTKDKTYLLCILKKIRKIEQIYPGDEIRVKIEII